MRRTWFVLGTCALLVCTAPARGDWSGFWSRFHTDFHRNNAWPEPFVSADRAAARDPFVIQTNNGWRLQNTIGDPYFDPATQELTMAGALKVKWIVTQAPMQRRTVFVLANESEEITQARVHSVQATAARFATRGEVPEVLLTDRDVIGGSGEYYDAVDRAIKSSVPVPRLPKSTGPAGAGAGAGAGGAGS